MDKLIEAFDERRLVGRRTFRLFQRHIEVETSGGSFRIPLEHVLREPITGKTFDAVYRRFAWIALACAVALTILISLIGPGLNDQSFPRDLRLAVAITKLVLLLLSLLLLIPAAIWLPQYEFAMFQAGTDSPGFLVVDVNRTGQKFHGFVQAVIQQIDASQRDRNDGTVDSTAS